LISKQRFKIQRVDNINLLSTHIFYLNLNIDINHMKLSKKDKAFIIDNLNIKTVTEMSKKLSIGEMIIRRYIKLLMRSKNEKI